MKIEKQVIVDGEMYVSSIIKIIYDDNISYKIDVVKNKVNNEKNYILYSSDDVNKITYGYKLIKNKLETEYGIEVAGAYIEDGDYLYSSCKIGNFAFDIICSYQFGVIQIDGKNVMDNNLFFDELAIYLTYTLIENISKKEFLTNGK